jgi:MFS family permease
MVSFFAFSVVSCLIPREWISKNIEKSLPELLEEGNYPKSLIKGNKFQQDNFTDALILNISISSDPKRPVWSALMNPFSFQAPNPKGMTSIKHLDYIAHNKDLLPNQLYGRYWHGSSSLCRILLLFMTYQQIKWLLYIISSLFLLVFAVKLVNSVGWIKSLPLFIALLLANFFVTQFSMQFFPVLAIALIGGIWMCRNGTKALNRIMLFLFVIGMFTAYFDLLTTPLLTLGIPLVVYLILQEKVQKPTWRIFKSLFALYLVWLIGFAFAWVFKWVLVAIFADFSAINAFETVKWRTSIAHDFTRWDAIVRNFNLIPLVWINTVLTFLFLLTLFNFNKKKIPLSIAFLVIGLSPYVWFFVLSNHSYHHWWFTYRAQVISMCCVMLFFASLIDWERLKSKLRNLKK